MPTESFFIQVELTEKDEITMKLLRDLNNENIGIEIPDDIIKEVKEKEEKGKKAIFEWMRNM